MNIVLLYTDGSCLDNSKSKKGLSYGGYGCHIIYPNNNVEEFSGGISGDKITNNIGELMAFKVGLQRLIDIGCSDVVHVHSDSTYLINICTKWAKEWENNGWKKSNNKDIENVELVQEIYTMINTCKIVLIFKKIKAHEPEPDKTSNNWIHWYGNDRADKLAKICAEDMKEIAK